jgi:hypothetical protein
LVDVVSWGVGSRRCDLATTLFTEDQAVSEVALRKWAKYCTRPQKNLVQEQEREQSTAGMMMRIVVAMLF